MANTNGRYRGTLAAALAAAALSWTAGARADDWNGGGGVRLAAPADLPAPASKAAEVPAGNGPDLKQLFEQGPWAVRSVRSFKNFQRRWSLAASSKAAPDLQGWKGFDGSLRIGWAPLKGGGGFAVFTVEAGNQSVLAFYDDTDRTVSFGRGKTQSVCRLVAAQTLICATERIAESFGGRLVKAAIGPGTEYDLFRPAEPAQEHGGIK